MLRTALFNWAYARHTGGTFVFRIEDTDAARDSEESYSALLEAVRWLGLDWDEGPQVGGPHGPYRQSERLGLYAEAAEKLLRAGYAYECFCSADELEQMRESAREAGRPPGYNGHCRTLTSAQRENYRSLGRRPVLRFRMPDHDLAWDDLVRGPVSFAAEHVPDFVIVRAGGQPLYTLVNPVDDSAMEITHVLRGEDLLSSTPRQLALYEALAAVGIGNGTTPRFGHLPYVMGEGNRKLSKRDPESSLHLYRERGYLPEALANYLALLGWSFGGDREFFTLAEMAEVFEISAVNASPARFDLKKCNAINSQWIRALSPDELAERMVPYLMEAGVLPDAPDAFDGPDEAALWLLRAATPLVQERMETLDQAPGMLGFLFAGDDFEMNPGDVAAVADGGAEAIGAALSALEVLPEWTTSAIEQALRGALIDGLGLKPRKAFGAVRVAVTGRRVSPPLFESMELLGSEQTLDRLRAALDTFG